MATTSPVNSPTIAVSIRQIDGGVEVFCKLPRRSEKAIAGTWAAHLRNMAKGLDEGFEYRLKAVFSHFPMTLKVDGNRFTITNMLGEKVPRVAKLPWTPSEVHVKIEGKSEKDVITRDCMGLDHAECLVDDHLEEMAYLLADARAEFGF